MSNVAAIKQDTHNRLPEVLTPQQLQKRAAARIRHNLALLADDMFDEAKNWLRRAAEEDPAKGFDLYLKMLEYSTPKLSRAEVKVENSAGEGKVAELSIEELQEMVREGVRLEHRTIEGELERD